MGCFLDYLWGLLCDIARRVSYNDLGQDPSDTVHYGTEYMLHSIVVKVAPLLHRLQTTTESGLYNHRLRRSGLTSSANHT